jgi:hypothetical protein
MSIILAIEPDRRRAAQLTSMARAHLRAELLVAPTAAQAVEVLNGRVPDVLLTAPLLASQEEAAMAEHLRQQGPAAAHVQTLTIPLLAGGGDRERPVLSAFRRDRKKTSRTEPEGCDPAVFAEQITEYLREAQERRDAPAPPPRQAAAPAETTSVPRLATAKNGTIARLLAAAVEEDPQDDFAEFLLPPAPTIPFQDLADESVSKDVQASISDTSDFAPDIKLSRSSNSFTSDVPTYERDTHRIFTVDERSALRDDVSTDSFGMKLVTPAADRDEAAPVNIAPAMTAPAGIVVPKMRKRARRTRRVGNEWGFFDPSQSGFPALIAKLDEIASRESDA